MLKTSIEKISPAQAMEMLHSSGGNRAMKADHIASLAAQMRRGEWLENGSSIVFDVHGALIDGHHRLMAVNVSETTQSFLIVRGAPLGAMFTIDTGKARTLADHLTLAGGTNSAKRASYLSSCVRVLVGNSVPLKTVEAYQAWEPIVHEGTEVYFKLGLPAKPHLRPACVAGPLILAYKLDSTLMSGLLVGLRDGEGLKVGSAVHTLREYLQANATGTRRAARETADDLASKVFAAAQAHVTGRGLKRLQAGAEVLDYFRKLYVRGSAGKLVAEAKATRNSARKIVTAVIPGEKAKPEKAA